MTQKEFSKHLSDIIQNLSKMPPSEEIHTMIKRAACIKYSEDPDLDHIKRYKLCTILDSVRLAVACIDLLNEPYSFVKPSQHGRTKQEAIDDLERAGYTVTVGPVFLTVSGSYIGWCRRYYNRLNSDNSVKTETLATATFVTQHSANLDYFDSIDQVAYWDRTTDT